MSAKLVVILPRAQADIDKALDWYASEGGQALSDKCLSAAKATMRKIGENPRMGSNRYTSILNLPGLRFCKMGRFPYLVFYIEYQERIVVGRVLHEKRDIPAWMEEGNP